MGRACAWSIELPVLKFGQGKPKGLLVAGQHGGEHSPLKIIKRLLEQQKKIKGTVTIIPAANPLGLIFETRNEPLTNKNLNRLFPGKANGDFGDRLAEKIFKLCLDQDFVIDLHAFTQRQAPFLAGYECEAGKIKEKIKKIIHLLKPELVWQVNLKRTEDKQFFGSLDGQLCLAGVPAVFLEMPNLALLNEKLLEEISQAIINVFNGFLLKEKNHKQKIKQFHAKQIYANQAGLFEARAGILDQVKAGEIIGEINALPGFNKIEVLAESPGTILTILEKGLVKNGSKIASLGINQTAL